MSALDLENLHASVLLSETIRLLEPKPKEVFVDATLGMGGHTKALLETEATLRVIGIDQDDEALTAAKERLSGVSDRVQFVKGNFADIKKYAETADGILADLGVSSLQFDSETRGFSFRFDSPLDMRMDAESDAPNAAELLQQLDEEEIANIIYRFGEERFSRRIARRIVERRKAGNPVSTTRELAELVERSVPRRPKDKIHPATKTFQALRIAVNRELEILEGFLKDSVDILNPNGRLVIISFHSLEDRIVKQSFLKMSGRCQCPPRLPACQCGAERSVEILTRKPLIASEDEISMNPRSRSAKLRAVRKLA
ncbi:MAG: 16S rRNA (cytosine(1402)-N(4))-methyltransferase RsmH [Pyrinomonadaceae bacterium]